jgi:hypothetical protein
MRLLILSLPAVFMCAGINWMFFSTMLFSQKSGRVASLRRTFSWMSITIGGSFVVWAVIVMFSDIVKIAYPIVIMGVGLLLVFQGWAFNKFKLF